MKAKELEERVAVELGRYHVGCEFTKTEESPKGGRECQSQCSQCASTAIIHIIRKAVEAETHKEHISAMVDEGNEAYKRGVAKTQREIGECIEKRLGDRWEHELPPWSITIYPDDIEALKSGTWRK